MYLRFFNDGAVPALHVTVQLFQLGYDQNKKAIRVGISDSPHSFYVASIQPKNSTIMPLDSKILTERHIMSYADAPKTEYPYYNDILEVRVRYYREADEGFRRAQVFFPHSKGRVGTGKSEFIPEGNSCCGTQMVKPGFPPFF